jgi:hypothetical protein
MGLTTFLVGMFFAGRNDHVSVANRDSYSISLPLEQLAAEAPKLICLFDASIPFILFISLSIFACCNLPCVLRVFNSSSSEICSTFSFLEQKLASDFTENGPTLKQR